MRFLIILFLAVWATVCHAAIDETAVKVKWDYFGNRGPAHWAQLSPDFSLCANGKEQSPIDIPENFSKSNDKLVFRYQSSPAWIIHDGSRILQIGTQQLDHRIAHGLEVNFHQDSANESVEFAGETYRLIEFHLHTPAETELHKQSGPMEIHFIHQGNNGRVLLVAVLIKGGAPNPELEKMIGQLPADSGKEYALTAGINPANLIPAMNTGFYTFPGSLTTPPCTEGVQWIVMADTITASSAQIVTLRKAMGQPNARPVQPLNKRHIYYVSY
jgi:carbonic anhydrase